MTGVAGEAVLTERTQFEAARPELAGLRKRKLQGVIIASTFARLIAILARERASCQLARVGRFLRHPPVQPEGQERLA